MFSGCINCFPNDPEQVFSISLQGKVGVIYIRGIRKVFVANRGEIAISVFMACTELGIRTVAVYSREDSGSYNRYKADEAYLVGEGKKPTDAYLDIEGIIEIAKRSEADAIHPGYGFLSENIELAKRCAEEGIIFIGPKIRHLDMFGDKVKAKEQAILAGIPTVPGSNGPVESLEESADFGNEHGYPIMVKASLGGGGRGMRIARKKGELKEAFERAKSEAKAAFGNDEVYVEKFIEKPKHIEVQILGDTRGNIVYLFERDCFRLETASESGGDGTMRFYQPTDEGEGRGYATLPWS